MQTRVGLLFWLLVISGTLLAVEGIVQRFVNSPNLLFLVRPKYNEEAIAQFASFAYRANAGQYFNLLWPVCLGFGYLLSQEPQAGIRRKGYVLLAFAAILAACPIVSSARSAALVDVAMLVILTATFLARPLSRRPHERCKKIRQTAPLLIFFVGSLILGGCLGWKQLYPRLQAADLDLHERTVLCEQAKLIARDYPVFGTGPGSFEAVFQLYRKSAESYWPAQLHNDWLEIRLTFGWFGSGLIAFALIAIFLRSVTGKPSRIDPCLVFSIWVALLGCLVQARLDFPLQVYSILFLFVVFCAVLFNWSGQELSPL